MNINLIVNSHRTQENTDYDSPNEQNSQSQRSGTAQTWQKNSNGGHERRARSQSQKPESAHKSPNARCSDEFVLTLKKVPHFSNSMCGLNSGHNNSLYESSFQRFCDLAWCPIYITLKPNLYITPIIAHTQPKTCGNIWQILHKECS